MGVVIVDVTTIMALGGRLAGRQLCCQVAIADVRPSWPLDVAIADVTTIKRSSWPMEAG